MGTMTMAQICAMWRGDAAQLRTRANALGSPDGDTLAARADQLEQCAHELALHLHTSPEWEDEFRKRFDLPERGSWEHNQAGDPYKMHWRPAPAASAHWSQEATDEWNRFACRADPRGHLWARVPPKDGTETCPRCHAQRHTKRGRVTYSFPPKGDTS